MSYPKITKEGSNPDDLIRQALAIGDAADRLIDALNDAAPKGVDYHPHGPSAFFRANDAHRGRLLAIQGIKTHADCLAHHVADQLEDKTEAA